VGPPSGRDRRLVPDRDLDRVEVTEELSARERQVLLCYANGMTRPAVVRTLRLSEDQVAYTCDGLSRKLAATKAGHGCRMAKVVAVAWRRCLIEADEIEGGPVESRPGYLPDDYALDALLTYREACKHLPPPTESWPELRARAHRLAVEYRASKTRRRHEHDGSAVSARRSSAAA
jgi:DNA-binding CsgD family transcriptional regulator